MKYNSGGIISRRALLATLGASVLTPTSRAITAKNPVEFIKLRSPKYGLSVKDSFNVPFVQDTAALVLVPLVGTLKITTSSSVGSMLSCWSTINM